MKEYISAADESACEKMAEPTCASIFFCGGWCVGWPCGF